MPWFTIFAIVAAFFFPPPHSAGDAAKWDSAKLGFLSVGGSVLSPERKRKSSVLSFVGKSESCCWKILYFEISWW